MNIFKTTQGDTIVTENTFVHEGEWIFCMNTYMSNFDKPTKNWISPIQKSRIYDKAEKIVSTTTKIENLQSETMFIKLNDKQFL